MVTNSRARPRVWAITMVKDEADIIGYTLSHLIAEGVDGIVVSDNLSTDATRQICTAIARSAPIPFVIVGDDNPAYYQSKKMSNLLQVARAASTEYHSQPHPWVIPFDADELFYSTSGMSLGGHLRCIDPACRGLSVEMWNHFPTYLDAEEGDDPNPFIRIKFRHQDRNPLPKVIVLGYEEDIVIEQGNHGARYRDGSPIPLRDAGVKIRHFPYRSAEHFVRKARNGAAAYKAAADLPEDQGAHWRGYGAAIERGGEQAAVDWFNQWFFFREDRMRELIHDPAPFRHQMDQP